MRAPVTDVVLKMIRFFNGNQYDICHFLKVHAYAKTIAEKELQTEESKDLLEVSAVLHDIACPLCREKYGHDRGDLQEKESPPLVDAFLEEFGLPEKFVSDVNYIVSHHHTVTNVFMPEHQVLLEADFLVNAYEEHYTEEQIRAALKTFYRTETGKALLEEIYLKERNA